MLSNYKIIIIVVLLLKCSTVISTNNSSSSVQFNPALPDPVSVQQPVDVAEADKPVESANNEQGKKYLEVYFCQLIGLRRLIYSIDVSNKQYLMVWSVISCVVVV